MKLRREPAVVVTTFRSAWSLTTNHIASTSESNGDQQTYDYSAAFRFESPINSLLARQELQNSDASQKDTILKPHSRGVLEVIPHRQEIVEWQHVKEGWHSLMATARRHQANRSRCCARIIAALTSCRSLASMSMANGATRNPVAPSRRRLWDGACLKSRAGRWPRLASD